MAHPIHVTNCRDLLDKHEFNAQELGCKLRIHFGGQFICFKWDNEDSLCMVIIRQVKFIDRIKNCFHHVSSGHIWHSASKMSSSNESDVSFILLCLENNFFLCSHTMIQNVIKMLCIYLDEIDFRISFMEYNSKDSSFKPKTKNKNVDKRNSSFSAKLHHYIRRYESLPFTNCVMTSDKLWKGTDSIRSQIMSAKKLKVVTPRYHVDSQVISKNAFVGWTYPLYNVCNVYPLHGVHNTKPPYPRCNDDNPTTGMSLQESIRDMVERPNQIMDQNDIRLGLRSLSIQDERYLYDSPNSYSENTHTPMEYEDSTYTTISDQLVSHDGTSNIRLEVGVSQEASKHEICITGSSFERTRQLQYNETSSNNATASATDYRLPAPSGIQQSRPSCPGLTGDSTSAQHQQHHHQQSETSVTEFARHEDVTRQRTRNDDLLHVLGRVRSPENANLTDRLYTFSRWPSDIVQTPAQVAEAGFYYTGLQDIVRCFACDGGLKNWDPDDDPWVEHARWFPQCTYVRHVKGEEFINLVRMMTEESDDEEDYTVHRGATWGGVENSNTNADSASNEITEPSVLENEAAQFVLEMGYSKRHVAVAINDILKKGKQDFTGQEIADIILRKETLGELIDSKLAADCPPSVGNILAAEQMMSENKHLKKLLQCTECKTKQRNILFLPCTHHVVCESCSSDLHICTYCYRKIKQKVRTYMS